MLVAKAIGNKILVTSDAPCLLERHSIDGPWGSPKGDGALAIEGDYIDTVPTGLYAYRSRPVPAATSAWGNNAAVATAAADDSWEYSNWVRVDMGAVGRTFGNYRAPDGVWGEVVTADDVRFTYLWGTDFKAANGQSFSDEQIRYFVNSSTASIARQLDITIKRVSIKSDLSEGEADERESPYDFRLDKIARYAVIKTRSRPIIKLHSLRLISALSSQELKSFTVVDKTKGILKLLRRPIAPTDTMRGIGGAIGMYGAQTLAPHLFYAIDYDAGFESSDLISEDLREVIAKHAAVSLLNIVGDGLMSGFSSSSLSMDGLSESFSSTQSATSAYFGARIKEYKDDIDLYIKACKHKFGSINIGSL